MQQKEAVTNVHESRVSPVKTKSQWTAWAALLLGVMMGLGSQAYRLIVGESSFNLISPILQNRSKDFSQMLHGSPAVFLLAAGLLLVVSGLFASLSISDEPF